MNQPLAVNKGQGVQCRFQQVADFGRGERAVGKNLRQVVLGVLHHHIKEDDFVQLATARFK